LLLGLIPQPVGAALRVTFEAELRPPEFPKLEGSSAPSLEDGVDLGVNVIKLFFLCC
jgi:hypothetical protein